MLPAALQGSCVLATATAPFGNEWVGQVPDLQLGSFAVPMPKGPGLFLRPNGPFLRV
jgi:hypothetical protein